MNIKIFIDNIKGGEIIMRFSISNVIDIRFLKREDAVKDPILERYKLLKKYGCECIKEESSDGNYYFLSYSIELSSLEELLQLKEDVKNDLIISSKYPDSPFGENCKFHITIYDDYVE